MRMLVSFIVLISISALVVILAVTSGEIQKDRIANIEQLQRRLHECRDNESKIEFKKVKKVVIEPGIYCLYVEESPGISIPVGCFIEEKENEKGPL